jgi:hypothetical protein
MQETKPPQRLVVEYPIQQRRKGTVLAELQPTGSIEDLPHAGDEAPPLRRGARRLVDFE